MTLGSFLKRNNSPIVFVEGMKHTNLDAERLYECPCGECYQVWANTEEEAANIENGNTVVFCPNCLRPTTEALSVSKHSGGYYNATYKKG